MEGRKFNRVRNFNESDDVVSLLWHWKCYCFFAIVTVFDYVSSKIEYFFEDFVRWGMKKFVFLRLILIFLKLCFNKFEAIFQKFLKVMSSKNLRLGFKSVEVMFRVFWDFIIKIKFYFKSSIT
jgi:hypothetical protein